MKRAHVLSAIAAAAALATSGCVAAPAPAPLEPRWTEPARAPSASRTLVASGPPTTTRKRPRVTSPRDHDKCIPDMLQKLQEINDAQPDDPRTVEDLFSDDCWPDGSSGPLRPTAGAPTADPPTAAPPSAPVSPGPNKAVVIGGAAGAGALTIAGGVLVGVAEATRSQPNGDTATADALLPPGIVLLVAGGVLGAGTAVYGLWPRDDKPPATVVVPVVGRGTVGLVWSGAF